jgi:D-glycero-D-manno-heptose 1,7-bisphosphate phosphatase
MAQSALPSQGRFYEELGIWIRVTPRPINSICPALFLDRDGVIVEDPGYLSRPSELVILPGACDVIASANRAGIPVVEITNQAGIARSYFGWNEFLEVEEALARQLAASGAACKSNAERLMTLRTSAVAVCCCSAS